MPTGGPFLSQLKLDPCGRQLDKPLEKVGEKVGLSSTLAFGLGPIPKGLPPHMGLPVVAMVEKVDSVEEGLRRGRILRIHGRDVPGFSCLLHMPTRLEGVGVLFSWKISVGGEGSVGVPHHYRLRQV